MLETGPKPITADMLRQPSAASLLQDDRILQFSKRLPDVIGSCFAALGSSPVRVSSEAIGEELLAASKGDRPAFRMEGPGGSLDFVVSPDLVLLHGLIDFACGGAGLEPPFLPDRPLSRFEEDVRDLFVGKLVENIVPALASAFATGTGRDGFAVRPWSGPPAGSMPHVVFHLLVNVAGYDGELRLGIAKKPLEVLLRPPHDATICSEGGTLGTAVNQSEAQLVVTLPVQRISVADLAGLRPGTLFGLSASASGPVMVQCEGRSLFMARLLKADGRLAIRIAMQEPRRNVAASEPLQH